MLGLSDGGVDVTVEGSNIKVSDDISGQTGRAEAENYIRRDSGSSELN